jgi:hypothetical protein
MNPAALAVSMYLNAQWVDGTSLNDAVAVVESARPAAVTAIFANSARVIVLFGLKVPSL